LAPVTIVGLYLVMFMWYVEQERKTRAFAQGLSGGKRVGRRPKGVWPEKTRKSIGS
jgi:hypothetical protein